MSSDFLGFGGLAVSTIGTVAITKEVAKTMRSFSKPPKRMTKKMKGKKKMASLSDIGGRYY